MGKWHHVILGHLPQNDTLYVEHLYPRPSIYNTHLFTTTIANLIPSNRVCEIAAALGRLDIMQWARTNGYTWNNLTCMNAAEYEHFELLQWAHANGAVLSIGCVYVAANVGNLQIIQWLIANGCPHDFKNIAMDATYEGHLHILEWLKENDNLVPNLCNMAARAINVKVLKWARAQNMPWDESTCIIASSGIPIGDTRHIQEAKQFEFIKWAYENGAPWNHERILEVSNHNNEQLQEWLASLDKVMYDYVNNDSDIES